jgi:hypothetical protein
MNATVNFIINHFQCSRPTKLTSLISRQITVRFKTNITFYSRPGGKGRAENYWQATYALQSALEQLSALCSALSVFVLSGCYGNKSTSQFLVFFSFFA